VQGTGKNDVSPTFEGRSGSCLGSTILREVELLHHFGKSKKFPPIV
jgi:hypothetical protein